LGVIVKLVLTHVLLVVLLTLTIVLPVEQVMLTEPFYQVVLVMKDIMITIQLTKTVNHVTINVPLGPLMTIVPNVPMVKLMIVILVPKKESARIVTVLMVCMTVV
jgi:hypothetical protein